MTLKPLLDAETAAQSMAEKESRYTRQEALIESNRCLFCYDAPCIMACPTGIDIPSFIKKIANGNPTGSARTILTANVLGASCARVCPTEVLCEGACVVLDLEGDPVKIGRLQRYATDYVFEHQIDVLHAPAKKNGKKIASLAPARPDSAVPPNSRNSAMTSPSSTKSRPEADSTRMASPITKCGPKSVSTK